MCVEHSIVTHQCRPVPSAAWLFMVVILLGGCGGPVAGLVAHAVLPEEKKVHVPADYRGLENQVVAVLVNLNEYAFARHPNAPTDLTWAVSKELREGVPGIHVINPDDIIQFQRDNPYWNTLRYGQLIRQLQVDRIVLLDVLEYSTHEPGNRHVFQGTIVADVKVIESPRADAVERPTNDGLVYSRVIEARHPKETSIGVVGTEERVVEVATLAEFSRRAAWLFYDHIEMRPAR